MALLKHMQAQHIDLRVANEVPDELASEITKMKKSILEVEENWKLPEAAGAAAEDAKTGAEIEAN